MGDLVEVDGESREWRWASSHKLGDERPGLWSLGVFPAGRVVAATVEMDCGW
jgi:hypothetical protein